MNIIKEEKADQEKSIWIKDKDKFVEYRFKHDENYNELVKYFKNQKKKRNSNLEKKALNTLNYIQTKVKGNARDKNKIKNKTITDNMLNKLYDDILNEISDNKNILNLDKSSTENLKSLIIERCIKNNEDFVKIDYPPENPKNWSIKRIPIVNNDKNNKKIKNLIKKNVKTVEFIISSFNITVSSQIFKKIKKIKIEKNKDNLYELKINVVDNKNIDRTFLFDEDNIAGNVMYPITFSNKFSKRIKRQIVLYQPFTTETSNKKEINIKDWFRLLDTHVRKINKKLLKDKIEVNKKENTFNKKKKTIDYYDLDNKLFSDLDEIIKNKINKINNKEIYFHKGMTSFILKYHYVKNSIENISYYKNNDLIDLYLNNINHLAAVLSKLEKKNKEIKDAGIKVSASSGIKAIVVFWNKTKTILYELKSYDSILKKDFKNSNELRKLIEKIENDVKKYPKPKFKNPYYDEEEDNDKVKVKKAEETLKNIKNSVSAE
jgi:hypothetical protein